MSGVGPTPDIWSAGWQHQASLAKAVEEIATKVPRATLPLGLSGVASHSALRPRQIGPIEAEFLAYPTRVARIEVLARTTKRRLRCPPFSMHGHRDMTLATIMMFMMVEAIPSPRQPIPKCRAFHYVLMFVSDLARVERVVKCALSSPWPCQSKPGTCFITWPSAKRTAAQRRQPLPQ
jgi:hypothetical protein